jgi:hypothetical protein
MQQSKKLVPFMNIMCVKSNILCFICQYRVRKILNITKMKFSSLKILRKRKEKLKIYGSFQPSVSSPPVPTQHANIQLHKSLAS